MNIHTPSEHVKVKRVSLATITAAVVAGAVIDCAGFTEGMVVFAAAPSGAGTTVDSKIQAGAVSDGSDAADITGGAFTQATTAGGAVTQVINFSVLNSRYIKVPVTGAGGSAAGAFSVHVHLFNPMYAPVSQDVAAKSVTI